MGTLRRPTAGGRAAALVAGALGAVLALTRAAAALTAPERPERRERDRMAWAREAAAELAELGLWRDPQVPLAALATRRDLARLLSGLADLAGREDPSAGLRGPSDMRQNDPDAAAAVRAVAEGWVAAPAGGPFRPDALVRSGEANRAFVRFLGLDDAHRALATLASEDGVRLRLPAGFADEVLAREAGLRHNYPHPHDDLELARTAPIRLADLAGMGAEAMRLVERPEKVERLDQDFAQIVLPAMTATERTVVERALSQVGQPYVWGGEWPSRDSPVGSQEHAGHDCSGLVWWAWRGSGGYRFGRPAVDRSTADGQARFGRGRPVPKAALRPGDLVFYGDDGKRTRRGGISHVVLALGNGYAVHSAGSRAGTSVSRLDRFWVDGFVLARRPLA